EPSDVLLRVLPLSFAFSEYPSSESRIPPSGYRIPSSGFRIPAITSAPLPVRKIWRSTTRLPSLTNLISMSPLLARLEMYSDTLEGDRPKNSANALFDLKQPRRSSCRLSISTSRTFSMNGIDWSSQRRAGIQTPLNFLFSLLTGRLLYE